MASWIHEEYSEGLGSRAAAEGNQQEEEGKGEEATLRTAQRLAQKDSGLSWTYSQVASRQNGVDVRLGQ